MSEDTRSDEMRDAADEALEKAVEAVPEGSELRRVLKQIGWIGLILGVLVGNVPVAALVNATASRKATVSVDALETYWSVLVLLTPFVVIFAIAIYMLESGSVPQISGMGWLIAAVVLWWGATLLSLALGGAAPITSVAGPTSGSPGGLVEYLFASIGDYISFYGPLPVLAGPVEGAAFGYWAFVLSRDE